MATLVWPVQTLPWQTGGFNPTFRNVRGGAAVAYGASDIAASDAGFWTATLGSVVVNSKNRRKTYRALQVLLEGGLTAINIPLCRGDQPIPTGGSYTEVPHDDDTLFDDDTGYVGTVIDVTLSASAALRATQIDVAIAYAAELEPGHHFSIGDRLYRIKQVVAQDDESATLKIWPPLREAASSGAELNFDNPVCRMRLAGDSDMDIDLQLRRNGFPSVGFVEDL